MNVIVMILWASLSGLWPGKAANLIGPHDNNYLPLMDCPDDAVAFSGAPYFEGHGLNPDWKIEIFEDSILFTSEVEAFEVLHAGHREPVKDITRKTYECPMANGKLVIRIGQEGCKIEGSNESFAYSLAVEVLSKDGTVLQVFEGCGHYITDARLKGKWVLQQIEEESVSTDDFNESLPYVEIVPQRNSFSGYTGCHRITGRIFSERSLLRFTDWVHTDARCDHLSKEDAFLKALSFSTEFEIEGDQLILSNPLNTTLILKRE